MGMWEKDPANQPKDLLGAFSSKFKDKLKGNFSGFGSAKTVAGAGDPWKTAARISQQEEMTRGGGAPQ